MATTTATPARKDTYEAVTLANIKRKLFTREDRPHRVFGVHKILGLGCLLHFIVRFVVFVSAARPDMGFTASWDTIALLGVHALLSSSALIFRIPTKRIVEGSRIWPEYRLHSIIFAYRSLACMAVVYVEQRHGLEPTYWINAAIVIATLAAADAASMWVGDASRSRTIRDLDAPPAMQYFFSVMQFHATAGCLLGLRRFATQFCYVWVIQFTAFLLTLRRKNLAPHSVLVNVYGAMLVFGFVVASMEALEANSWAFVNTLANVAAVGRLGLRINKYALWLGMAAICWYARAAVAAGGVSAVQLGVLWALSVAGVVLVGKRKLERYAAAPGGATSGSSQGGDAYPVTDKAKDK